jgi:ubiquitin-protein ligase E3 A
MRAAGLVHAVSFLHDVLANEMWDADKHILLTVRREHAFDDFVARLAKMPANRLKHRAEVKFAKEVAAGPGVTSEFLQLALQQALEGTSSCHAWQLNAQTRTFWPTELTTTESWPRLSPLYFAAGVLLGQSLAQGVFVPPVFPRTLFAVLLHSLRPSRPRRFELADIAAVDPEFGGCLAKVLTANSEAAGAELLDYIDWPSKPEQSAGAAVLLSSYVSWFFGVGSEPSAGRFALQLGALCDGFGAVVANSRLICELFDEEALEQLTCPHGVHGAPDFTLLRQSAKLDGWDESDTEYISAFWEVVGELDTSEQRKLLLFITASDRMPLRGWRWLSLLIKRNGDGDDRLPTAFTCFHMLLLPRFSGKEQLRSALKIAIHNSSGFGLL